MGEKVHITADVPADLIEQVDKHAAKLDMSRSAAIRKGLALFLRLHRQELTENVSIDDDALKLEPSDNQAALAC